MRNLSSKLVLGTAQMGSKYGINNAVGKIEEEKTHEILKFAFENGINVLDTAESYGDAHEIIGRFHSNYPNHIFQIITKLSIDSKTDVRFRVSNFLKEMRIDRIYTLMFHSYDLFRSNSAYLNTLLEMKADGDIELIGVSAYTNEEVLRLLDEECVDIIQIPYNLLDNINQRGSLLNKAKILNKKIHSRSCFLQGLFFIPLDSEKNPAVKLNKYLIRLNEISLQFNEPLQKIALLYCLQEKLIDHVLIGVDSLSQLEANISCLTGRISDDLLNEINKISVHDTKLLNPALWNKE